MAAASAVLVLVVSVHVFGDPPPNSSPEHAYRRVVDILDAFPNVAREPAYTPLFRNLLLLTMQRSDTFPNDIRDVQLTLLQDSANDTQIRGMALLGLRWADTTSVIAIVRSYLNSTSAILRRDAARVLSYWGLYSEAVPIFMAEEFYLPMVNDSVPGVLDSLRSAIAEASPLGQITAAQLLDKIIKTGLSDTVALQLLDKYVINHESYGDKDNLNAAINQSLGIANTSLDQVQPYVTALIDSPVLTLRWRVFAIVTTYARDGNKDAQDQLLDISKASSDSTLAENAAFYYARFTSTNDPRFRR
jgi:hypothetical protein